MSTGSKVNPLVEAQDALNRNDYTTSKEMIDASLRNNPHSVKALLLKAQYESQLKNYVEALKDTDDALKYATGRRKDLAQVHYKRSCIYYRMKNYKDSFKEAVLARKYADSDTEIIMFYGVIARKYQKTENYTDSDVESKVKEVLEQESKPTQTSQAAIEVKSERKPAQPVAPVAKRQTLTTDWFEMSNSVDISVFIKGIEKESVEHLFERDSIDFKFKDAKGEEYAYSIPKLYSAIDPANSNYRVFGTKLEISLKKAESGTWKQLEAPEVQDTVRTIPKDNEEPSKKIDWSKFNVEDEDEEEAAEPIDFFQKLYADADEETRRAMMKSYVESNGTSLSTDWSEVSKKKVEPVISEDN